MAELKLAEELIGKKFSQEEIERFFIHPLLQEEISFFELEIVKLISAEMVTEVVKFFLKEEKSDRVMEIINLVPEKIFINIIAPACIEKIKNVKREGAGFAEFDIVEKLINLNLETGKKIDKKITNNLILACISNINVLYFGHSPYDENHKWYEKSVKLAEKFGMPEEATSFFVGILLSKEYIDSAVKMAKLGGRCLNKDEINYLVNKYVKLGWVEKALEMAKLGGRDLTEKEWELLKEKIVSR